MSSASKPIDLCDSPLHHRIDENGVVEICEGDDDAPSSSTILDKENMSSRNRKRTLQKHAGDDGGGKPAAKKSNQNETPPLQKSPSSNRTTQKLKLVQSVASATNGSDEECMVVGRTGKNSISDFPHSREHLR